MLNPKLETGYGTVSGYDVLMRQFMGYIWKETKTFKAMPPKWKDLTSDPSEISQND